MGKAETIQRAAEACKVTAKNAIFDKVLDILNGDVSVKLKKTPTVWKVGSSGKALGSPREIDFENSQYDFNIPLEDRTVTVHIVKRIEYGDADQDAETKQLARLEQETNIAKVIYQLGVNDDFREIDSSLGDKLYRYMGNVHEVQQTGMQHNNRKRIERN